MNIYGNGWTNFGAYLAGYIWADGCLYKKPNTSQVCIVMNSKDKEFLEGIRAKICPHRKLYETSAKGCYQIHWADKEDIKFLEINGLVQRKSLIITFPEIPDEYLGDFLRGYFDGDGSIVINNGKIRPYFRCKFVSGSISFIKSLDKIFMRLKIMSNYHKHKNSNTYELCVNNLDSVQKLFYLMYEDSCYRLERKYKRFIDNNLMSYTPCEKTLNRDKKKKGLV